MNTPVFVCVGVGYDRFKVQFSSARGFIEKLTVTFSRGPTMPGCTRALSPLEIIGKPGSSIG
jgi:hypothetical protein